MSISDKAGDKSGEASMDEILASIRKIIADDPNAPRNGPDRRAVNPLLDPLTPPLRMSVSTPSQSIDGFEGEARPLPPADRLAEAIRASAGQMRANTEQRPPIRQRSFADHSLDDLMDDAPPRSAPNSGNVPSFVQSEPPSQGGTWASWRNFKPGAAPNAPSAPQTAAPQAFEAVPPMQTEPVQMANLNGHGAVPAEPAPRAVAEPAPAPPAAKHEPVVQQTASPEIKLAPVPEAGVVPAVPAPPAVRREPPNFASVFPRPERRAPLNASAAAPAPEKPKPLPAAEPVASSAPVHMNGSTPTEVAASQALEKLAAGLSEPPAPIPTEAILAPATAASPPAAVPVAAAAVESAPTPVAPARTLEDAVTDMIRPMLEKWVEANMPRLMEKALRGDLSKGQKPPGT